MKKKILNVLYLYNIHIGHNYNYNTELNNYILGKRLGFYIIDLSKSFILLKKALFFVHNLSLKHCSFLFYYSQYPKMELWYRCLLLSLIKKHSQSIVIHNWIYGSISNYYFTFFHLIKEIHDTWLNHNIYLSPKKHLNKHIYTYYNSNSEESLYSFFHYKFLLLKHKNKSNTHLKSFKWYRHWLRKQNQYRVWKLKKVSSYYFNFLKKLFFNDIYNVFKKKTHFNFKYLFLKLFYFLNLKKKDYFFWDSEVELKKKNYYIHNKFKIYWRLILYFKYFNNFFQLPEAFFCIFPDTNDNPLREYSNAGLNSIGLVDTNNSLDNINYPIISNDDSIVIIFFYYSLISNILSKNKLYFYKLFCR